VTDPITSLFVTDAVTNVQHGQALAGRGRFRLRHGIRGLRGELMPLSRKRDIDGTPGPGTLRPRRRRRSAAYSIRTTTLMFNGYYDLGSYRASCRTWAPASA